ncbi:hypothetical protein VIGAN_01419500 [Vigna angularis var. angularis]|uniref:Secreted protein n=1 Tax=Vigna angularis var. angularis TaxID=157739 RepID=A0A0S3R6V6_PHAAN|nr:hypothetical protein VIGAN_01419500 [Vigna angularis var. angularis]
MSPLCISNLVVFVVSLVWPSIFKPSNIDSSCHNCFQRPACFFVILCRIENLSYLITVGFQRLSLVTDFGYD